MALAKDIKELFFEFAKEPSRDKLRNILKDNVGEEDHLDFKREWMTDFTKLAKHILAFGNSGGGCIVFGVEEGLDGTLATVGLDEFVDKAVIQAKVRKYIPDELDFFVSNFDFSSSEYEPLVGCKIQVVLVESDPTWLPYICLANGSGISEGVIYVRDGTESKPSNHERVQKLISRRIETGHSSTATLDLKEHLLHLKLLYGELHEYLSPFPDFSAMLGGSANPRYPEEDYEEFVLNMIEKKKCVIERVLSVNI